MIWLRTREQNQELATQIAEEAITSLSTFRGESKFSTWLYKIARNKIAEEIRTKSRRRKNLGHRVDFPEDLADPRPIPQLEIEAELVLEQLERGLSQDDGRFLDGTAAGKDQNELATDFGITARAAESRRRRLPAKVKKILQR